MKMTEDRYNELQARNSKTPGRVLGPKVTSCHLWQQGECACTGITGCQKLDADPVPIKPLPHVFRSGREKPSKYRNVKTGGYSSKKEHKRALELQALEAGGFIRNLREQVKLLLLPPQKDKDGRCLERACYFVCDFVYEEGPEWKETWEDTKGHLTEVYRLKRKLALWTHGVVIKET